jgi:hypothetical protein
MFRNAPFPIAGFALLLVATSTGPLLAQDAVLAQFYGSGVHQYFSGNYDRAAADLTTAIEGGSKDPRAYYFRALTSLRRGDSYSADSDLRVGASLESADVSQFYPVGKSLERVQGADRKTVERHRAIARAEAFQRRHDRDLMRYEQRRRAESQVLRSSGVAPLVKPPGPSVAEPPVPGPEPADDDPFADKPESAPAAARPAAAPPIAAPSVAVPPAAVPPAAVPPAAAPPVAAPPATEPAEDMPAEAPAAEGDPFADEPAADAKPAAGEKPAEPPAAEPKAGDEDPFADDPK